MRSCGPTAIWLTLEIVAGSPMGAELSAFWVNVIPHKAKRSPMKRTDAPISLCVFVISFSDSDNSTLIKNANEMLAASSRLASVGSRSRQAFPSNAH